MAGGAGAREDLGADGDASLRCKIPDYPGEEPLQHLATQWREQRDDALRDAVSKSARGCAALDEAAGSFNMASQLSRL